MAFAIAVSMLVSFSLTPSPVGAFADAPPEVDENGKPVNT